MCQDIKGLLIGCSYCPKRHTQQRSWNNSILRDCEPMHTLMVKEHYLRGDMCLEKQSEVQRMKEVSYSKVIESLVYCVAC